VQLSLPDLALDLSAPSALRFVLTHNLPLDCHYRHPVYSQKTLCTLMRRSCGLIYLEEDSDTRFSAMPLLAVDDVAWVENTVRDQ
jgi:hypothetical protein